METDKMPEKETGISDKTVSSLPKDNKEEVSSLLPTTSNQIEATENLLKEEAQMNLIGLDATARPNVLATTHGYVKSPESIAKETGVPTNDGDDSVDTESTTKPLDVINIEDAKSKVSDLVVFGNGDAWELLCKASSKEQGWMKSTKVMEIGKKGIMMQVTTEFRVNGVITACAEAIQFLEGVRIQRDSDGKIEKLY